MHVMCAVLAAFGMCILHDAASAISVRKLKNDYAILTSTRTSSAATAANVIHAVLGYYEKESPLVKHSGENFVALMHRGPASIFWKDRAKRTWGLWLKPVGSGLFDRHNLEVRADCPYYKFGLRNIAVKYDSSGKLTSLVGPWNKTFLRLQNSAEYMMQALAGKYKHSDWGYMMFVRTGPKTLSWNEETAGFNLEVHLAWQLVGVDRNKFLFLLDTRKSRKWRYMPGYVTWDTSRMRVTGVRGLHGELFKRIN